MVNIKSWFWNKFISFLIRKIIFFNKVLSEVFFERNVIPEVITDRKYFSLWEERGYHISQNHFYHPIPDVSKLDDSYWNKISSLSGIKKNIPDQLKLLSELKNQYIEIYNSFPVTKEQISHHAQYFIQNNNFTSVDGEVLYSFIRKYTPKKIIEIGSGYSSFLISQAICDIKNITGVKPQFISIEPFPRDFFKTDIAGLDQLIEKPVQEVDISLFKSLKENDILFIDSTHVMKYNSDVEYEIFNILPVLAKGVIIHFHDIFIPLNYPKKWITENGWFWNEQQFLLSFLMYNDTFEIVMSNSLLRYYYPHLLRDNFTSFSEKENPGSLWIRKLK